MENLLHELCNVSVVGKNVEAATTIRGYIKETILTMFIEGLEPNLRQIIKSRHHTSLEEAINYSLEEENSLNSLRIRNAYFKTNKKRTGQQNTVQYVLNETMKQISVNLRN
jgi:hypothetical protein